MTLLEHLRRMARNNLWSNDRLYRAVLALNQGEFEAERTSFFPSIKKTLNHILAVDHLYLDFLTEGGLGAAAYDTFVPFDDAQAWRRHRPISTASLSPSATACRKPISTDASSPTGARTE